MLSLVRHGRTAANAAGLLVGRLDPGLDEVGTWQASRLVSALGPVDRVVASPLLRTRQTAAVLGLPVEVDERFVEIDYGELDGVPFAEIDPAILAKWRDDADFAPTGGESMRAVSERVADALAEVLAVARDDHVVVVSHVLPIKAAVALVLGVGIQAAWRLHLDQASITRISVGPLAPLLRGYNDIGHLAGGPPVA